VRSGFTVDELLVEDGQVTGIRGRDRDSPAMVERAPLVVGADGRHSLVARTVQPARYHERDPLEAGYYAYWSGVGATAFEVYARPNRSFAATRPTMD
jgi:flavin-dependent dehydrogenase